VDSDEKLIVDHPIYPYVILLTLLRAFIMEELIFYVT
jgi:hypothetical protein